MIVGTRIVHPEEVDLWKAEIIQISVYRGMKGNLKMMMDCVYACHKAGMRYVIHPVSYSLLDKETLNDIMQMAAAADLSLILHDERTLEGERLTGTHERMFRKSFEKIKSRTHISFENATNSEDVKWFWESFADSITLDIGHVESSGLDSLEFVKHLDESFINKIQYVHLHRNNGLRGGITDHWPLNYNCREVQALKELLKTKSDISVILEINEVEKIGESLNILRSVRDEI